MILIDSSVWIDHFRNENKLLSLLLSNGAVVIHEFILGELAIGNFKNRKTILSLLDSIPKLSKLTHDEFLYFIENNSFFGKGVGFVDIHILGAAKLNGVKIWTLDKRLLELAISLNLNYELQRKAND
ncbi:MAG: type II toxin-antitoxin system VapC family toxin [Melioribacteraceae bacterium]|nr:type II toxin-antitoxin system VapC family toxin [Melioribacteraceae bacterium]